MINSILLILTFLFWLYEILKADFPDVFQGTFKLKWIVSGSVGRVTGMLSYSSVK